MAVILAGIITSLCLHALLFSPLFFGAGRPLHRLSGEQGDESSGVAAMTMLALDEPDESTSSRSDPLASSPSSISPTKFLLPVGGIRIGSARMFVAPIDVDPTQKTEESGDSDEAGHALMFGRYIGQVTARVERAWLRPRTAIGAQTFRCTVQIAQDQSRSVEEVTLKECNGTNPWQMSLVRAIESASPLPAPPDPSVFSKILTFEMESDAFREGGPQDGFEPMVRGSSNAIATDAIREQCQTSGGGCD